MKWVGRKVYVASAHIYEACFLRGLPEEEDMKGWSIMRIRTSWLAMAEAMGVWPWNEAE